MKKLNAFALLAALFIFVISSCKKEEDGKTITQTINVTLTTDQSYSYSIPKVGDADDVMQITKQAVNYKVSQISPIVTSGGTLFEYTPSASFTGTDEVDVSSVEDHHGNQPMHGNCSGSHHHGDTYVYIFKFTIGSSTK